MQVKKFYDDNGASAPGPQVNETNSAAPPADATPAPEEDAPKEESFLEKVEEKVEEVIEAVEEFFEGKEETPTKEGEESQPG